MPKVLWRTLSIRVNESRKSVALQFRWPLEPEEFDQMVDELQRRRDEMVDDQPVLPPLGPSAEYVAKRMREG